MKRSVFAVGTTLLCLLGATGARCEITPVPGNGDPHIQSVVFDPQQVVALHIAAGFALTVQFSPDERIQTVTVGDLGSWLVQVNHAADHLVIKPQGNAATTNLTVVTDARTYNFTLYAAGSGLGIQPYFVQFAYNPPAVEQASVEQAPAGRYRLHGDKALWPDQISDNGTFTAIRWPATASLPAIYRDDGDGHLALVNAVMKDGFYAVDGVHRQLIFLSGKRRARAVRDAERNDP